MKSAIAMEPNVYLHRSCNWLTEMPSDCMENYLSQPFFYDDTVYCSKCEKQVPHRECTWQVTGQSLADYFGDLRARFLLDGEEHPRQPRFPWQYLTLTIAIGVGLMYFEHDAIGLELITGLLVGLLTGAISGMVWATVEWLIYRKRHDRYRSDLIAEHQRRQASS